jgi:hypothetical protein
MVIPDLILQELLPLQWAKWYPVSDKTIEVKSTHFLILISVFNT